MNGNTTMIFQSLLSHRMEQFLAYKRTLGRRYDAEAKTLRLLDRYLADRAVQCVDDVTPGLIDAFLASRPRHRPRSYNHLLGVVRCLFQWLVTQGVLQTSPVKVLPRRRTAERLPFIFDVSTARRLLEVAAQLPDNARAPMRGHTYQVLFAILYGLGLRVSEACRLLLNDVDLTRRVLVIRQTKFYKSRLVPFGPRLAALLQQYRQARLARVGDSAVAPGHELPFFSFTRGRSIHPSTVTQTFHALIPRLHLELSPGSSPPRLHDLRHSFAVGTLLRWYRNGEDAGAQLFKLSTFLGHVDPNSTAVYLKITATLLEQASKRFEAFAAPAFKEGLHP